MRGQDEETAAVEEDVVENLEADEVLQVETTDEATDLDDEQETPEHEADEEEADEPALVVTIGEEEDEDASQPIRELRQQNRELTKRLKELVGGKAKAEPELGERPKLADFDFDEDKHADAVAAWLKRKDEVETQQQQQEEARKAAEAEFFTRKTRYDDAKTKLGAKDYDDAEEAVKAAAPSGLIHDIIIDNAKSPELVTYALGKNPDILKSIPKAGNFRDAVAAAYALGAMEAKMKVTSKTKPKPETRVEGAVAPIRRGDRTLEQLRAKAAQTGDYSEVRKHRKKLRETK